MGYEAALKKAWDEVLASGVKDKYAKFLNDEYEINYEQKNILSMSCNAPAKDYYKLLILHYLANESSVQKLSDNNWISFKELEGGKEYFSAFKKRAINPIIKKYGDNPEAIFERAKQFNAEKMNNVATGISISAFPKVKVGIVIWPKDEEFDAECNMLFNIETSRIFPTEDVAVLGGIIAYSL